MEKIKNLEEKITSAIEKVKVLKDENSHLSEKLKELEKIIAMKDEEINGLSSEKHSIKNQVEELLEELESLEI
ncbi:MAG: cell division protein ZapB [Nitrospirota bacterium]|nr:MAG: cell division protein ZapB [Nitrospirota bacterium]